MSKPQKVLIAVLLIGTLFFWIAVFFIPRIQIRDLLPQNASQSNQQISTSDTTELTQQYGHISGKSGVAYVREVVKPQYFPDQKIFDEFTFSVPAEEDRIILTSPEWTLEGGTFYTKIYNTVRGSRYSQSNLPLVYEIYAKAQPDRRLSEEELIKSIGKYFHVPSSVKTDNPERFAVALRGTAVEFVWKNADNSLESRSAWNTQEQNIVYFIACRIFPDAPEYQEQTCYKKK